MLQQTIHEILQSRGWYYGENLSEHERSSLLKSIGTINMVTQVTPNPLSRSMVTSRNAIGLHTDHHRADYILWHCIHRAESGGESMLVDSRNILDQMSEQEIQDLEKVSLMEHKVFPSDRESHPMLEQGEDGYYRIYYSFWLARKDVPDAFQRFRSLADAATPVVITLKPNDVLLIDNRRILHGRSAIAQDSPRHLVRYWIEKRQIF